LSNILHSATEDSLVILDEVGRGTATYDGISIAWSATEYIVNEIKAKTLFATHYHELTALGDSLSTVQNVHVAADERDGDVTFLRTIEEGPTDRSYGIHVADLAGVPDPVVDRSREVLDRLRDDEAIEVRGSDTGDGTTQAVFDLESGQFTTTGRADTDAGTFGGSEADLTTESEGDGGQTLDPDTKAVLEELEELEVHETSPVELMNQVQTWKEQLND
jgi:DNA mismatch repair protein MutS